MKKILYVAQSAGGVAEYLYMLLNNIKNKYDCENILVLSEDYRKEIEKFEKISDKIYFVPMIRNLNIKSDVSAIFRLKKIIKKTKPDIVYLHSSKAGAIGRIALLFNFKIKVLYNAHGWYFNAKISKLKRKIFTTIEKILAIKTDKIINISKAEYDSAINAKIARKSKMCIIENGIDFSKFKDCDKYREITRKKYAVNNDDILIGVVGRISEQKDPMTSIKAFKMFNDKYKNSKFMFIGDGKLKKDIIQYSKNQNIENNLIITGWINDVEKYIPALDIAILPSKWEGFGLAIIEYMICRKPIIATKTGGIADIIKDERNGFLIEIESKNELYECLLKYVENEKRMEEVKQYNYNYVISNYNIDRVVKDHIHIFEGE